jgi:hypothetical protein
VPIYWVMGINEQTCTVKDGYLKDIQHAWAVMKKIDTVVSMW